MQRIKGEKSKKSHSKPSRWVTIHYNQTCLLELNQEQNYEQKNVEQN